MTPNIDEFQALARSAPWRFRRAHFEVSGGAFGHVEAHLERPGVLRYRADGGSWEVLREANQTVGSYSGLAIPRWASDTVPSYRPDGLVDQRPDWFERDSPDDPMLTNYQWVAMLDPVELSHHVTLSELGETAHHGRRAWRARAVPLVGYEPRCGCCPLLWSRVSDAVEVEAGWDGPPDGVFGPYPSEYTVILDHATGMVVHLQAGPGSDRTDLGFDVRIHAAS